MTVNEAIQELESRKVFLMQSCVECWDPAMEMALQALKAQRWIPCSEQMPPIGIEVLATCSGFITTAAYIGNDIWFTCEGNSNATTAEIDAWMPKPNPYEVEE